MSENFGNGPIRRENLSGQHDSKSVASKFQTLSPELRKALDNALNAAGFSFEQCFTSDFLDTLTPEQRQELSSLNGNLILSSQTKGDNKETIRSIVKILGS